MLKRLHIYLATLGSDTVAGELVGGTYRVLLTLLLTLLLSPFVSALVVALALAQAPAAAQDVPLAPAGEGVKTVVVATKFPFTISAPAGGAFYVWKVPAAVTYTEADETITITAAPGGDVLISLTIVTVDFDAKKIVKKSGKVTVAVGGVAPPPPPPPPPPPAVKVAYAIVVDDVANRTAATAAILGDLVFWQGLGVPWHHYDVNDPMPPGMAAAAAKAGAYPALVLLGAQPASGAAPFIRAVPLPATRDEVKKAVQQ